MRISDWSSDVCSSDLAPRVLHKALRRRALADRAVAGAEGERPHGAALGLRPGPHPAPGGALREADGLSRRAELAGRVAPGHQGRDLASPAAQRIQARSEEHTSELQSLMRISYAVFCLKKKT